MALTSCGLYCSKRESVTSSRAGNTRPRQGALNFAYAQSMLAMFCGGNSQARQTRTSAILLKSCGCSRPTVAKAHAVLESSCVLNVVTMWSRQAASASARNNWVSWRRTRAKAHTVLAMPCVAMLGATTASSRAKLENTAWWCAFTVPNAQAMVARHCELNSPSRRRNKCGATELKNAWSPRESFAKDHSKFDNSNGFISPKRPCDAAATRWKRTCSRNRSVAQDQQMMLKHRISLATSPCFRWPTHCPFSSMTDVM
mmetsp:Transcript_39440/g.111837  ORF Transcript_39440/g.111837 Transcript_39440/m.111837 type:complete len:257 (+) Transcript_39440:1455-2225(+)